MWRTITTAALLLANTATFAAIDCSIHRIYCKIVELKPSVNKSFAMELSNYLYAASRHYGTEPMVSVAIAMQESSLRNIDRYETVLTKDGKYIRGVSDIGVFQFHVNTVKNLKLDPQRLRSDLSYAAWQHVRLLARKQRVCKKKGLAKGAEWSCYHSYTPKYYKTYQKQVKRYL